MLRHLPDHETFMSTPGIDADTTSTPVDPLDEVFGSASSSPSVGARQDADNDAAATHRRSADPSDIPRLRSTHVTNGYREGVAASKEKHMQAGFDEGYGLGAELGLQAGWCLGALEGMLRAVRSSRSDKLGLTGGGTVDELEDMLGQAEVELGLQRLIGAEYFGADGIWLYEVPDGEDGKEILFAQVAKAHPVVSRWIDVVCQSASTMRLVLK